MKTWADTYTEQAAHLKDTGLYDPSLEHTDYLVEGIVGTV